MLEFIQSLDFTLFKFINGVIENPLFDFLLPILREKTTWYPLYILIIGFAIYKYKWFAIPVVLTIAVSAGISDYTSSKIIKPLIERPRPCKEKALEGFVVERANGCRKSYSFPSSHATNHFAIAFSVIMAFGLGKKMRRIWWLWAAAIAFSQVYVGLHYVTDIIAGSILGILIAFIVFKLLNLLPELLLPKHWRKEDE